MSTMNGSAYLAEAIKQAGLTHLFHVPTAFFGTMVALEGSGVQRVLTHGEKAAAYMADGYARASGKPGLCMAPIHRRGEPGRRHGRSPSSPAPLLSP